MVQWWEVMWRRQSNYWMVLFCLHRYSVCCPWFFLSLFIRELELVSVFYAPARTQSSLSFAKVRRNYHRDLRQMRWPALPRQMDHVCQKSRLIHVNAGRSSHCVDHRQFVACSFLFSYSGVSHHLPPLNRGGLLVTLERGHSMAFQHLYLNCYWSLFLSRETCS